MTEMMTETSTYAWIIDKDHLEDGAGDRGVSGPWNANVGGEVSEYAADKAQLTANYENHFQFRMYDDDGELYYTGTMFCDGEPDEEACYGPLGDFGMPNAGAVLIKYTRHPEMDCG